MSLLALLKDIFFNKNTIKENNTTPRNTHKNTKTLFYYSAYVTKDDPRNEGGIDFKIWAETQEQAFLLGNRVIIEFLPMISLENAFISDNNGVDVGMQVFDKKAIVLDTDMSDDKLKSQMEKFKKHYSKHRGWDLT